jgi:riboflavin kinase / FMN adenylyltransferase
VQVLRGGAIDADPRGSVVAIGVFDGVHRGHQYLIARVVEAARREALAPTVVTFDPHPARVLAPEHAPRQLESLERRLDRLARLGVEQVRVLDFDQAASREDAHSFVRRVLVGELGARVVIVGEDFHFGRDRGGDVRRLTEWSGELGYDVQGVTLVGRPERYSSTGARKYLEAGDLRAAEAVLGHRFVLSGTVVHGDHRGATLGFPTANLATDATAVTPASGIYAGVAHLADQSVATAISIGQRPQFYVNGASLVEAYLLDFSGDLYGQALDLVLIDRLRDESSFPSTAVLVQQITRDVAETKERCEGLLGDPESLLGFFSGPSS